MRALPRVYTGSLITAKCDPDEKVQYRIEPIKHGLRTHIVSETIDEDTRGKAIIDWATGSYQILALSLKELIGLKDADGKKPFELEFEEVTIFKTKLQRVKFECIDRLPRELYDELSHIVGNTSRDTDKELGSTLDS